MPSSYYLCWLCVLVLLRENTENTNPGGGLKKERRVRFPPLMGKDKTLKTAEERAG